MFRKLGISRQLLLLFGAFVLATVAVTAVCYQSLSWLQKASGQTTENTLETLGDSSDLLQRLLDVGALQQRLLREKDLDELDKLVELQKKTEADVVKHIAECGSLAADVATTYKAWAESSAKVRDIFLQGNAAEAQYKAMTVSMPQMEKVTAALEKYNEAVAAQIRAQVAADHVRMNRLRMTILAGTGGGVSVLFALAVLVRSRMVRGLRGVSQSLAQVSGLVHTVSDEVSQASRAVSDGANNQAASLEETSASLEEMASQTKSTADGAQKAKQLADEASQAAAGGEKQLGEMSKAMDAINHSSQQISQIIKTINDIAFQTNILALNAAVEAARAGEAGKGFAVVAEEVRSLAKRSAEAADKTGTQIQEAITRSTEGITVCAKVTQSLHEIVSRSHQVNELVTGIATAANEQSTGVGQISSAVSEIDKVTQANSAHATQTTAATEQLVSQMAQLDQCVRQMTEMVEGASAGARTTSGASTPTKAQGKA